VKHFKQETLTEEQETAHLTELRTTERQRGAVKEHIRLSHTITLLTLPYSLSEPYRSFYKPGSGGIPINGGTHPTLLYICPGDTKNFFRDPSASHINQLSNNHSYYFHTKDPPLITFRSQYRHLATGEIRDYRSKPDLGWNQQLQPSQL